MTSLHHQEQKTTHENVQNNPYYESQNKCERLVDEMFNKVTGNVHHGKYTAGNLSKEKSVRRKCQYGMCEMCPGHCVTPVCLAKVCVFVRVPACHRLSTRGEGLFGDTQP